MKTIIRALALLLALSSSIAVAEDPPLPKDPPAATLNSNPPSLYSQWVTVAKYYYAKDQARGTAAAAILSGVDMMKVTVIAPQSQVKFEWDYAATGQAGFIVERSADGSTFTQLVTLEDPAARLYVDKGLAPGSYWYRVRAYAGLVVSGPSNEPAIVLQ